jgi:surfactin family lipopeptide synthetase A
MPDSDMTRRNLRELSWPPDNCVHQLFEQQVMRTPSRVAVCFEGKQLTYSELNAKANQLAHSLLELGVGPEVLVGFSVERSLNMLVGLLGILKAGAAYIPLDPGYPKHRLSYMLDDSQLKLLVTESKLIADLPPHAGDTILLDADRSAITSENRENPVTKLKPENLAYVLYTSGSTGRPKGVQIEHRSLVNFLGSIRREPGLTEDDVLVSVTTLSFDIAGLELYLPLTVGARVVIASRRVACDGERLLKTLEQSAATVMQATPVTWRLLIDAGWQGGKLRVICGGEALSRDLARQLVKRSPSVWNMYGPTETTIWSSVYPVVSESNAVVPIGKPIANTQMYVLDSGLNPVPSGALGELYIGGDGLARGYLNQPELTAQRFVSNPFCVGTRLYRTGDLARCLPTGDIEFLGRTDHQVKIRGFRVETGEIESVLEEQPGVRQAVVMAREDVPGDIRLIAYFVPQLGAEPKAKDLERLLKQRLPSYMVPAAFVRLGAMPQTDNGKVDRRALPPPNLTDFATQEGFVAPRDTIEAQLAKVWERIFGRRPIGVRDNFFDLGGHSLLAVRMMQQVEQDFHKRLPVATLLEASTVEQMAQLLRQEEWSPQWSSLVALQAGGSKTPFFCIHGIGGEVLNYRELALRLGPDQPVYGLQAQGLDGKHPCHERVEDMAEHYIKEIRRVQPVGPYYLGGQCFGGVVAFEMARQLHAQRQEVGLVALLDAWRTNYRPRVWSRASRAMKFLSVPTRLKSLYLLRKARNELTTLRRKTSLLFLPRALKNVRKACRKAASLYVPTSYAGGLVLFRARDQALALVRPDDPFLGWGNLALGGIEVRELIGDYLSILTEPDVANLATELAACLERSPHVEVNDRNPKETVMPRAQLSGAQQSPMFT